MLDSALHHADADGSRRFTLGDLVGDTDMFTRDIWRKQPSVHRGPPALTRLISEDEIWETVDCGLLIRPYFVAFNEGVRSALSEITESRDVVGHTVPGYINPAQVRADFAAGGTFKLNQPEHWHGRLNTLVEDLAVDLNAELETYVFLSPPDRRAIETHMDGSHVFVIQVAGRKDWTVGLLDDESVSVSDRYRGKPLTEATTFTHTMEPGDVLYMPHGSPHHAIARDGNSIHVAVTVEEPTPSDLSEVLGATLTRSATFTELEKGAFRRTPAENVHLVTDWLSSELHAVNLDTVTATAARLRRQHWK